MCPVEDTPFPDWSTENTNTKLTCPNDMKDLIRANNVTSCSQGLPEAFVIISWSSRVLIKRPYLSLDHKTHVRSPKRQKKPQNLISRFFLSGYRIAFSRCEWTVAIYLSFTVMIMTLCIGRALYCSKIFTGKLFNSSYHLMVLRLNTGIIHVCLNLTPPVSKLSEMKKNNHIFIL